MNSRNTYFFDLLLLLFSFWKKKNLWREHPIACCLVDLSLFFFVCGAREWNETGVLMLKFMVCYESAYGFENLICLVWLCKSYDLFHYHPGTTISVPVVAF